MADISPPVEPKQPDIAHPVELGDKGKDFSHVLSEGQNGGTALVAQDSAGRAADSNAFAKSGVIGDVQITGLGDQPAKEHTSDARSLISDYDEIAKKAGAPELTTAERIAIATLPSDQKDMYRMMLNSLDKLANKEINPAEYMAEGLRNAAKLAQTNEGAWWNPFGSTKAELFVDYVGVSFSDKSLGLGNVLRAGAGSPFDLAGAALERAYGKINGNEAGKGFNTNITDSGDPNNSVTHHYREFLMVGFNRGRTIGNYATTTIDKPEVNPGDVRNGYFGTMIGSALANGKINPSEAAEMTIWAYTAHGGKQPPWGDHNVNGQNLKTDDYFLNPWLKAFRAREQQ